MIFYWLLLHIMGVIFRKTWNWKRKCMIWRL